METNFKVGDIVYDSVNYPNRIGLIFEILTGKVYVNFESTKTIYSDKAYNFLSFTPYELKGFTQERPWQPKEGEWIGCRNMDNERFVLEKYQKYNSFIDKRPLEFFIKQNEKL